MDNKQIKDGLGNVFTIRMRDVGPLQDGSMQRSMIFSTPYPLDYGGGGIFQHCAQSGVMAPGMVSAGSLYAFRWPSAGMSALIFRVRLAVVAVQAFSGGVATFSIYAARQFTAGPSGGISAQFGGDNNQLRSSMAASAASIMVANTGALTPGTRVLDAAPLDSVIVAAPTNPNTPFLNATLFQKQQGEHPLFLAQNEGFVIVGSVPLSNTTWQFSVTTEWAEVQTF
jgi:hypothetical protein